MAQQTPEHNPFMLLVHPEAVFAAVEKSERLSRLNRHLCRPLDRPAGAPQSHATASAGEEDTDDDLTTEEIQTQ